MLTGTLVDRGRILGRSLGGTLIVLVAAFLATPTQAYAAPTPTPTPTPTPVAPTYQTVLTNTFGTPAAPGTVGDVYRKTLWVSDWKGPRYDAANVSVRDGTLDIRVRQQGGYVVFDPQRTGYTYGRWEMKFRVTGTGTGQGLAMLLWPNSDRWEEGEIDLAEGNFGGRDANIKISHHEMTPCDPGCANYLHRDSGIPMRDREGSWHTVRTDWTPRSLTYSIDGRWVAGVREHIPSTPHRPTLQVAGHYDGDGNEVSRGESHVQVAWVRWSELR